MGEYEMEFTMITEYNKLTHSTHYIMEYQPII